MEKSNLQKDPLALSSELSSPTETSYPGSNRPSSSGRIRFLHTIFNPTINQPIDGMGLNSRFSALHASIQTSFSTYQQAKENVNQLLAEFHSLDDKNLTLNILQDVIERVEREIEALAEYQKTAIEGVSLHLEGVTEKLENLSGVPESLRLLKMRTLGA